MSKGLGKGLDELLPKRERMLTTLSVSELKESPYQPRESEDHAFQELVDSVRQHGILQPVLVRKKDGAYELIAGHRRVAAARAAGLRTVPVYILSADEARAQLLQLIENLQRQDLNPIEEARGIKRLMAENHYTQEQVAKLLGKSRSEVANTLRLLQAPDFIQRALEERKISKSHARTLLALPVMQQRELLTQIVAGKASVRQLEAGRRRIKQRAKKRVDPDLLKIQNALEDALGVKVRLKKLKKGYQVLFELYSDEELESLIENVTHSGKLT